MFLQQILSICLKKKKTFILNIPEVVCNKYWLVCLLVLILNKNAVSKHLGLLLCCAEHTLKMFLGIKAALQKHEFGFCGFAVGSISELNVNNVFLFLFVSGSELVIP